MQLDVKHPPRFVSYRAKDVQNDFRTNDFASRAFIG